MTLYITDNRIVITSNGTSQCFYGYTLPEALKTFLRDGNTISNKRWIKYAQTD